METIAPCTAVLSDDPAALAAIREEDCHLAVWQRRAFADFAPLVEGQPTDLRFESDLPGFSARFRAGLASGGFGGAHLHDALADDAALLARLFCAVLDLARFEVRLEVVRSDSCRRFHADYVRARLITTYVGEGTDWLDHADAGRVAQGQEPRRINRLSSFDVGLFKGRLATERPAIHRSPPIADTGQARLLMVLNPVQKPFVDPAN